ASLESCRHIRPGDDTSEDSVITIQIGALCERHVHLTVSGGRNTGMGHCHGPCDMEMLLRCFRGPDRLAARRLGPAPPLTFFSHVARSRIAPLDQKPGHRSM